MNKFLPTMLKETMQRGMRAMALQSRQMDVERYRRALVASGRPGTAAYVAAQYETVLRRSAVNTPTDA